MKTIGSQTQATLGEESLFLLSICSDQIIVVTEDNKTERWVRNDDFAGFVLTLWGRNYEFVETIGEITAQERKALRVIRRPDY